jgi:hypothetical protein
MMISIELTFEQDLAERNILRVISPPLMPRDEDSEVKKVDILDLMRPADASEDPIMPPEPALPMGTLNRWGKAAANGIC